MAVLLLLLLLEPATEAQFRFATSDATGFDRKRRAEPGDWLHRFPEAGQSFERYVRSGPVRGGAGGRSEAKSPPSDSAGAGAGIAFLPVGPFAETERALLQTTVAFARLWFDLEATVLADAPLPKEGWRREGPLGPQYRTPYFLDHLLPDRRPKDAVCVFGVTMADLYPDDDWNFVFGQASLKGAVGIWSFRRFGTPDPALLLRRACRLVVHEVGHAFGLEHCIAFECVMNGSNSLPEADSQPLRLCPRCLKKLQWNRGFDVLARYGALRSFYETHGLAPEAKWVEQRVARIRAVR